jgi:hypothetical protein
MMENWGTVPTWRLAKARQEREKKHRIFMSKTYVMEGPVIAPSVLLSLDILMYGAEPLCCAAIRASQGSALSMLSHKSPETMWAGPG